VKMNPGQGWEVEIAIPWAAVKGREDAMSVRLPPQVGDRWRMNVVRVDKKQGAQNPTASSWNRISYQDWHGLERMLTVVFADQGGGVAPGTPARPPVPGAVDPGTGSGSAAAIPMPNPGLLIEAAADGTLRVNGKVMPDASIGNLFAAAYARDKETTVVISADPAVPHARIVSLLDRAKLAGITKVAVTPPTAAGAGSGSAVPAAGSGSGSAAPAAGSASGSATLRVPAESDTTGSAASRTGSASGPAAPMPTNTERIKPGTATPAGSGATEIKAPAGSAGPGSAASGSSAPAGSAGSGSAR
jgi:hypothetical protein